MTGDRNMIFGASCPRCGATITPRSGGGRPRRWCTDQCRRLAYEERRAARAGAVGIEIREPLQAPDIIEIERVIEREVVREIHHGPTPQAAVQVLAQSPRACRDVLLMLAAKARTGELSDNRHTATVRAAADLHAALRAARLIP